MTVQEVFESIRVNDKNKIRIQLRDNLENYICETYIHALGMKPYYSCEVTDWEPFVDKEHPGYVKICANIIITEPVEQKTEDVINEAKAVIKESKEVIKQTQTAAGFAQAPKMEKICQLCGKPFHPNSGVQKYCAKCKAMRDDIKKTARDLVET